MSPADRDEFESSDAKVKVTRPDEMPPEVFEFIDAIEKYKRRSMKAHLASEQVLAVVRELGYGQRGGGREREDGEGDRERVVEEYEGALEAYKKRYRRPFPNWSEVFEVLREIGFNR
jgi:hypothetical protein